jgi:hypothetical protein
MWRGVKKLKRLGVPSLLTKSPGSLQAMQNENLEKITLNDGNIMQDYLPNCKNGDSMTSDQENTDGEGGSSDGQSDNETASKETGICQSYSTSFKKLYQDGPCQNCTCNRRSQINFKNENVKQELHSHMKFDKQDGYWEVDLLESLSPRRRDRMRKKRFLSM